MGTRKSYYVKPGNFKNLKIAEEKILTLSSSEVTVDIRSIGLNFADVFCILGLYEAAPKEAFVPGLEFSGTISAIGEGVDDFKVGDKVMGVTRFGAYTTSININHRYVVPLPEGWDFIDGSAFLVQVLTAYYGLVVLGNISHGMNVLIHSAAGGVGLWANRICKYYDCYTIGTVGSASKTELLKSEGYDRSIVREPKSFKNQLKEALGERELNLVMDSIGGSILKDGYRLMAPMGRLISFGSAHYGDRTDKPNYLKMLWKYIRRPKIDPQSMIGYNKSVMGFNLVYLFDRVDLMHKILKELRPMNLGRPIIGKTFSFDELPDALREFQSGKTQGKLVVEL